MKRSFFILGVLILAGCTSYYRVADPTTGKVFCLSEGPSKEAVMRIHERAGHPTTEVYEIPVEV